VRARLVDVVLLLMRWGCWGQAFWRSPFNVFDVLVTAFCSLTLLVLAFARCGTTSKEEELFDTLLLIARNVVQFGRLASVMRQCVLLSFLNL
jgi:hypothetical protein